jgi:hypothetical protein
VKGVFVLQFVLSNYLYRTYILTYFKT